MKVLRARFLIYSFRFRPEAAQWLTLAVVAHEGRIRIRFSSATYSVKELISRVRTQTDGMGVIYLFIVSTGSLIKWFTPRIPRLQYRGSPLGTLTHELLGQD